MVYEWRGWGHGERILEFILSKWEGFGGVFTRGCMRTVGYGSSGGVGVRGNQYCHMHTAGERPWGVPQDRI